jgi:hypothetical protein
MYYKNISTKITFFDTFGSLMSHINVLKNSRGYSKIDSR